MLSRPEGDFQGNGTHDFVDGALREYVRRQTGRSPPTNIEWAALRMLTGCKPVIVPVRRGGAWLYVERLTKFVYEIRMLQPTSVERGRARFVSGPELDDIIIKIRTKRAGTHNPPSP